MRRRDFIAIAGGAVAARPRLGAAQQSPEWPRLTIAIGSGDADQIVRDNGLGVWPGFLAELRRLGYVEGANLVVERNSADGQSERFDAFISDITSRIPTLIVTLPNPLTRRFVEKTKTIPIVAVMADPLKNGMVTSLAHPGSNLTGVSIDAGSEIWGKRLQIIKDSVPSASKVAYLGMRLTTEPSINMQSLQMAGERLGLSVTPMSIARSTEAAYRDSFAVTGPGSPDAIVISDSGEITPYRSLIAELAIMHRIPTIFPFRDMIKQGALMAYGNDLAATGRQLAGQVVKILRGAKPSELPIEQATRFALAINLKTAAAMGFTFPSAVLAQADEVIE